MFVRAMQSPSHPILAQIVPIRRCNLDCAYCNEYDRTSEPVPIEIMLRRIDLLADLGTTIITLSGGEPTLHPQLDLIIRRIRERGAIATLITNGLLLAPDRIRKLERCRSRLSSNQHRQPGTGRDIEEEPQSSGSQTAMAGGRGGVRSDHQFGPRQRNPQSGGRIFHRRTCPGSLALQAAVGILHDHTGQLKPLAPEHEKVYNRFRKLKTSLFSFAHFDSFQENISRGVPTVWHCRAGGRFLYICEDGLVHYCSQQRGRPGIPLERYTIEDLKREGAVPKGCAPFCTISCVHQTAMLDDLGRGRAKPLRV